MLPQTLSDEEISSVLRQASKYGLPGDHEKWRALMVVLCNLGPRISECLLLKWTDIDFERLTITFPTLKRRKPMTRTIPLVPAVADVLKAYRATVNGDPRVFPMGKTGRCIAWRAFQKMLKRAGIPLVKLHALRHTSISRWADVSLALARDLHGHANVATTNIYYHVRDIRERMQMLPPIT